MAREKDITETGPKALRGIRNPDLYKVSTNDPIDAALSDIVKERLEIDLGKAVYRNYDASTGRVGYSAFQDPSLYEPQVTPLDYGSSKYDTGLLLNPDQGDIQDKRANSQSGFLKIVNGLAKGAVLATTTFLDGTVGLALGAGTAISEGRWSGLWDNDFSKAMQAVNEWSEKALPNYYTQDEQNNPWDHIFSANFIGDKFIKNLGFTVGALYSGGVISGGVRGAGKLAMAGAKRLGSTVSTIKNISNATTHVATGVGAFTSALNEGRIEALNNSKDWYNVHKLKLDEEYQQRIAALKAEYEANAGKSLEGDAEHGYIDPAYEKYKEGLLKEEEAYKQSLANLNEKRAHMGNVDLIMNLPILLASNFFQFARFYANGFKTARKTFNIVGSPGKYTANTGKQYLAAELGKRGLAEGSEEISQRAASEISGDYYSTDVMNFYKSKTNRGAEKETLDFMKSFADGIVKTVGDGSAWEEFLIGALTGIMGVPKFRSMYNAQDKLQSPVTLYNEGYEKWKENKQLRADEAQLVDALNNRFNSEDFLNYYQGLIRHNRYQAAMNKAAQEGNEFDFKNSEHAQLVSDIIMFDKAGKLNDLMEAINVGNDTSEENLRSIVENTTAKDDSGKLVGPFAQYAALDSDGKIIANFGSEQDKKNMAAKLEENGKEITKTIEAYRDRKDEFLLKYGDRFTDDQLSDLTWMKLQLDNWGTRAEQMMPSIKEALGNVLGVLDRDFRLNLELRDNEGKAHADLTDLYKLFDKNVKNISDTIKSLQFYKNLEDRTLAQILVNNSKAADSLIDIIEQVADIDTTDAVSKLNDLSKMDKAIDTYNAKLAEYLKTPQKLSEDQQKADDEIAEKATAEEVTKTKDSLRKSTTLKEFKDTVNKLKEDNIEEVLNIDKAIQDLANEGNQQAKAYQDINQYIADVNAALTAANLSPQTLSDASNILNTLASDSNSLEELMNPEAVVDDEVFLEEGVNSLDDAKNRNVAAQYALNKAKEKVNSSNKFKDRFSAAYQTPTDNEKGTGTGVDEVTTGDSKTPTIPDTGGTTAPSNAEKVAIGDDSIEDIKKDNKELNESVEDPVPPKRGEVKQYYRPAVPELHIEASKKGDFRPFDIVVKEREGISFSEIYNYLVKNKVFEYLNSGNLHEDDELGFMIDPEFEREVEGKEWHKKPTIFIINKRDGHIVGSLDESEGSVKKFEGLKELEDRIISEYNNKKSQNTADSSRFIATPTTNVSQIMVGKVPYSEDERNLKDVLETYMSSGKEVFFGIIKNVVLNTNGKVDSSKIMPLKDISGKEGRLYLLVPNGANKYSPVAVRVKHFNAEEFNPADVNLQGNPIMNNIQNAIKALSEVTSKQELDNTVPILAKVLYKGNLHIDFVDNAYGTGIRFTKIFRDSNGEEIYEVDSGGNRKRKEEVVTVDLTKKGNTIAILGDDNQFHDVEPTQVPQEQVIKEITDALLSFNLPIQISVSDVNTSNRYKGNVINYNKGIIEAGLLTSNLTEMGTRSTWFTTDYFDAQGNPHKAINPVYKANPNTTTSSQGAISGVQVTSVSDNKIYFVDLQTNTIRDSEGKAVPTTSANEVLIDIAWAQKVYGDATEGVNMFNNKVITPSGKALDRTTQKYLNDRELQLLKQDIADMQNRTELVEKANKVLERINEDQSKVDKTRTDSEYYYIQEDDGQYHQYERVHKALGSNWIGESTSNANSSRALAAGSAVDSVIRQYFMTDNPSTIQRPDKLTKNAFSQLLDALSKIKARMEANEERFLTNNIVLYYKYSDGRRVAGEVDILAINKNGRYSIYDVKTSARSFSHPYFTEKGPRQIVSTKDYYTLQLSAYQNLFESKYDSDIRELGIVPFVLGYYQNTDVVNTVVNEPDIPIIYNPSVSVPLVDTTQHNRPKEEVNAQNTPNNAQAAINALNLDDESDEDEDILRLREATKSSYELLDKEQELAWLDKVLPQLSREDRVKFVDGLIKVGREGVYAWGKLDKGIVTLSDIAAKGTVYHEAFHVVFNYLLDPNDSNALLTEYSKKMPNADNIDLEEALAEDFREFVMQGGRDTRSLGRKIIDFFKSLFIKTKYWKHFRPSSIYYFRQINEGSYANRKVSATDITRMREEEYTQEMKDILAKAPRDSQGRLLAPNGKVSNLTERQYAQVRTKAFKEWFGDWERVAPSTEASNRLINYLNDISNRKNRFSKLAKMLLDNGAIPYNLKYFKIDNNRDDVEGYAAMWHSLANLIEVLGNNVNQESINKAILHELIHYNTEQLLQDYKNNKEIPNTQKEAIKNLYDIIEYSKNYLSKELQINRDKYLEIAKRQSSTVNSRLFYAFDNKGSVEIDEFISEIFTNPGLQEVLNNIPYKESKQSLWDKIKDAISSIFGFDINKGSVLDEALKESSKLIQNNSNASKVVDENGEPLVVYHGSTRTSKEAPSIVSIEYFTTPDIEQAASYTGYFEGRGKREDYIRSVFMNLRNPLIIDNNNQPFYKTTYKGKTINSDSLISMAKHDGYDGFLLYNTKDFGDNIDAVNIDKIISPATFAVFNSSNQIKSATDNIGTFSTTNNDIRYRVVPNSSFEVLRAEEKEMLLEKGWTAEKFDSVSQRERDHAMKCLA